MENCQQNLPYKQLSITAIEFCVANIEYIIHQDAKPTHSLIVLGGYIHGTVYTILAIKRGKKTEIWESHSWKIDKFQKYINGIHTQLIEFHYWIKQYWNGIRKIWNITTPSAWQQTACSVISKRPGRQSASIVCVIFGMDCSGSCRAISAQQENRPPSACNCEEKKSIGQKKHMKKGRLSRNGLSIFRPGLSFRGRNIAQKSDRIILVTAFRFLDGAKTGLILGYVVG